MTASLIVQDEKTGEICRLETVETAPEIQDRDGELLVDCDEDAWLWRTECKPALKLQTLESAADLTDRLYPVIAVDNHNTVLMFAFANKLALENTITTGFAHYYSRSRNKQWKKGEDSGHTQKISRLLMDHEQEVIIYKVEQIKGACHTGFYSCFYRKKNQTGFELLYSEKKFNPEDVYRK